MEETKTLSTKTIIWLIVALAAIFVIVILAQKSPQPSNSATNSVTENSANNTQVEDKIKMAAQLSGASEVPAVNTIAAGSGTFTVDTERNIITFNITFSGLSSAETGAHIHGPAAIGVNAGVLFPLPAGNPKTGTVNYLESQETDILAGRTYVNIHSANFPGGEIRGQILPQ